MPVTPASGTTQTISKAAAGKAPTRLALHALAACWLGMVFDGMDTNNFIISLHPALKELLHTSSDAVIGAYGASTIGIFMAGWAVGSITFGFLADYIGRAKTLMVTVLFYATCTGMCTLAHTWPEMAVLRFLVGCGIGGEASIGGVILAELWTGRSRLHAAAILQTGFGSGMLLLGGVNLLIGHLGWRGLYLVGTIPALLAIYVRSKLDDPQDFKDVRAYRQSLLGKAKSGLTRHEKSFLRSPLLELFAGQNVRKMVVVVAMASSVSIGSYAVMGWIPPWINQLTGCVAVQERSYAAISQSLGNILGCATAGFVIARFGRTWAFRAAFLMAFALCGTMFLFTREYSTVLLGWIFLSSLFVFAPYAYLFIYVPELFDTRVRATAFAFCIQSGRLFTTAACFAGGYLVARVFNGSYALSGASMALVYVLALVATFFMPFSDGTVSRLKQKPSHH